MPELLTCRETPKSVAGRWPASNRNGGRIHFGMVADIKSERWPASRRNTWPTSIGIRSALGDQGQGHESWLTFGIKTPAWTISPIRSFYPKCSFLAAGFLA